MVCGKSVSAVLATMYGNQLVSPVDSSALDREEKKILVRLRELLDGVISNEIEFEEEEEMEVVEGESEDEEDGEWDGDESEEETDGRKERRAPTEKQIEAALAWYRAGNLNTPDRRRQGTRTLGSMMNRYRFIKDQNDMHALLEYEKSGRIKNIKVRRIRELSEQLETQVKRRLEKGFEMHDRDVKAIARKINKEFDLCDGFKAAPRWIDKWKRKHRIVSRKITKVVAKKQLRDREVIMEKIKEFMKTFHAIIALDPTITVYNCDQTAVLKEQHGQRTLAIKGAKKVETVVQSVCNTTHSLTYLPIVSLDGTLREKFFIQLSEATGQLPKIKQVFSHPSLVLDAARSHIMNRDSTTRFFKDCLFADPCPSKLLLVLDSWSLFKQHDLIRSLAPPGTDLTIINIPAGATGYIQPLDVNFNQQFKCVLRRSDNHVLVHELDVNIGDRDTRLKVVTQLHRQFRAPIFKEFLKYSWYKGGFLPNHPHPYKTPPEFLFGPTSDDPCHDCNEQGFILCAHCCHPYCYICFYITFHRC